MTAQRFAMGMGLLYVLVGLLGFVPGLVSPPPLDAPHLNVDTGYGYLMGLFPINVLHNLVHIGVGLWGIAAYRSVYGSVSFARGLAIFYGALTIMGLIPVVNTMVGLIPIFSHDIWLHALSAAAAGYVGFVRMSENFTVGRMTRRAS